MCNSSRPNVTARSRPALMHQIAGTQDICRGLESEELVLENFHQGSSLLLSRQGRGRAGSLGQPHSPLRSTGTRAGGSDDVTITLTHTRRFSLTSSPSLAFLFWEATLGITPSAPPSRSRSPSRSGLTHFHLFLKQRRTTLYSNTWRLQRSSCVTIRI